MGDKLCVHGIRGRMIRGKTAYILSGALFLLYLIFISILYFTCVLSLNDFINSLTIFIGWLVAITIVWIQLRKTGEDNRAIKREEIKKSLEIDGFKEINKAVTKFSNAISEASIKYMTLPGKLKLHKERPGVFPFDRSELVLETNDHRVYLYGGVTAFVYAIEGNEIAVIEYDHLRKYIQFRLDDTIEKIDQFRKYLMLSTTETLLAEDGIAEFKNRCNDIYNDLADITSYLFDYRIELMNSMLGDIFKSKVPRRKPKDPQYKILTDVATKDVVEAEAAERQQRYLCCQGQR